MQELVIRINAHSVISYPRSRFVSQDAGRGVARVQRAGADAGGGGRGGDAAAGEGLGAAERGARVRGRGAGQGHAPDGGRVHGETRPGRQVRLRAGARGLRRVRPPQTQTCEKSIFTHPFDSRVSFPLLSHPALLLDLLHLAEFCEARAGRSPDWAEEAKNAWRRRAGASGVRSGAPSVSC